jgi:flagellar hook-length control protein FliK
VVITISAYTEPAIEFQDTGPPQLRETEKFENPKTFADLLAGLLSKTGMEECNAAKATNEASASAGTEIQADVSIDYESEADVQIDSDNFEEKQVFELTLEDEELPDIIVIPQENLNILFSVENLLARQEEPAFIEEDALVDMPQPVYDAEQVECFAEAEPNAEFLTKLPDNPEAAQAPVFTQAIPSEALPKENDQKQERALPKTESVELPPAEAPREEIAAFRKEPDNEAKGRLDEARNRDKRKDKVTLEVRDYRSGTETEAVKSNTARLNSGLETKARVEAPVQEMTLELRLPEQGQNQAETVWETKAGKAFEDILARELHQNFNGDIVRHASMALRDGGEGTIKLSLKPESLGNVKIHLELAENKITGRIVVESEEALRAFKREIHSLEQAFKESGFNNANLNLSMSSDGRGAQWQEPWQEPGTLPPQTAAVRYDAALEEAQTPIRDDAAWYRRGLISINVLA